MPKAQPLPLVYATDLLDGVDFSVIHLDHFSLTIQVPDTNASIKAMTAIRNVSPGSRVASQSREYPSKRWTLTFSL